MPVMTVVISKKGNAKAILSKLKRELEDRMEEALPEVGHVLLAESHKLVPQDTEALLASSHVRKEGHGFNTVIVVGYGRKDFSYMGVESRHEIAVTSFHRGSYWLRGRMVNRTPWNYATYVHQGINQYGPLSFVNGQANFLGQPLLTKQDEMRLWFNLYF